MGIKSQRRKRLEYWHYTVVPSASPSRKAWSAKLFFFVCAYDTVRQAWVNRAVVTQVRSAVACVCRHPKEKGWQGQVKVSSVVYYTRGVTRASWNDGDEVKFKGIQSDPVTWGDATSELGLIAMIFRRPSQGEVAEKSWMPPQTGWGSGAKELSSTCPGPRNNDVQ